MYGSMYFECFTLAHKAADTREISHVSWSEGIFTEIHSYYNYAGRMGRTEQGFPPPLTHKKVRIVFHINHKNMQNM